MAIVKIQNRRGGYSDFDPSKLLPGEFAVVQVDDPNTTSGTAVYIAITAGSVVRLATAEEIAAYNQQSQAVLVQVQQVASNTQTYAQTAQSKAAEASQSATAAANAEASVETMLENAENTISGYADAAKDEAVDEINGVYQDNLDSINSKIQQIRDYTATSDILANQALAKANNVENELAEATSSVDTIKQQVNNIQFTVNQKVAGGYVDSGGYLILTDANGNQIGNRIGPFAGGGGGGGGGSTTNAEMSATNTTGWISNTISEGSDCNVKISWSSVENEMPTGNGVATIKVNGVIKASFEVPQGEVTFNLKSYLSSGTNSVIITLADVYAQERVTAFNISVVTLRITSTFDTSTPFTGVIAFPFTPVGDITKTVHFILDGREIGTQVTSVSNRQLTYTIPAQSHGGHTLRVYYEATINNQTVRSNELYYEFISIEALNDTVIITSSFSETTQPQYASIVIPFMVYDPTSLTANVTISVNGTQVSSLTVDRTEQSYTYKANDAGTLNIVIASRGTSKTISITVTESEIDVEAETEDLALYLTSYGRSNQEPHPEVWNSGTIECTLSNFNWASDGWQTDADGITVLRVSGDARVTIPYKLFASDFRATGKTIELEFATRNILNYDATILSCLADGRGLTVTAQKATLTSEQSEISTQYKEDEHVRIAFVAEKRAENRLLYIYINGIASGAVQYPVDDDFSQPTPVNISVGSNYCTIDLYCIRVYDNDLTRHQVVNNWIADTQVGSTMLERYTRNDVFDAYGNIVINKLPSDLPYMIISCAQLPQSKGDKKTCSGSFVNPRYPSRNFTFENCQIDVQGTSSQYYTRKNYKMKFNGGFVTSSGTISKYAMNNDAIPVKTFTMKADYASSEGANNVELVRLYESACPYQTPAQQSNSKVRQGIDGFPILIFWNDTVNQTTTFIGKYNFNNDKSTEEVFGFASPDESWETLNNASDRVLYKSGDFSGSGWKSDFEARYPDTDPAYEDISQLAEFAAWAASTDTTAATGNALPEAVTYGETTYTIDNAEYRLAKFKAEAGNYMEMQSALFYYLFTELFLMVDSRAKNAFPSFIGSEVNA